MSFRSLIRTGVYIFLAMRVVSGSAAESCAPGFTLYSGLFNVPCSGTSTCWATKSSNVSGGVDATPYGNPLWDVQCPTDQPQLGNLCSAGFTPYEGLFGVPCSGTVSCWSPKSSNATGGMDATQFGYPNSNVQCASGEPTLQSLCPSGFDLYKGTFNSSCGGTYTCWAHSSANLSGGVDATSVGYPGWDMQCTSDQTQLQPVAGLCPAGFTLFAGNFNTGCHGTSTCWAQKSLNLSGGVDATPYGFPNWDVQCTANQTQMQVSANVCPAGFTFYPQTYGIPCGGTGTCWATKSQNATGGVSAVPLGFSNYDVQCTNDQPKLQTLCPAGFTLYSGTFNLPCGGNFSCWSQTSQNLSGGVDGTSLGYTSWNAQCTADQTQLNAQVLANYRQITNDVVGITNLEAQAARYATTANAYSVNAQSQTTVAAFNADYSGAVSAMNSAAQAVTAANAYVQDAQSFATIHSSDPIAVKLLGKVQAVLPKVKTDASNAVNSVEQVLLTAVTSLEAQTSQAAANALAYFTDSQTQSLAGVDNDYQFASNVTATAQSLGASIGAYLTYAQSIAAANPSNTTASALASNVATITQQAQADVSNALVSQISVLYEGEAHVYSFAFTYKSNSDTDASQAASFASSAQSYYSEAQSDSYGYKDPNCNSSVQTCPPICNWLSGDQSNATSAASSASQYANYAAIQLSYLNSVLPIGNRYLTTAQALVNSNPSNSAIAPYLTSISSLYTQAQSLQSATATDSANAQLSASQANSSAWAANSLSCH